MYHRNGVCAPLYVSHLTLVRAKNTLRYTSPEQIPHTAERLRYFRCQRNLYQSEVADYAGIDRSTYIGYEDTTRDSYPPDKLHKIAELLQVDIFDLMDNYNRFLYEGQGQSIKALRKSRRLTQDEFSSLLQTTPGIARRWEHGKAKMTKVMWERMQEIEGCSTAGNLISYLQGGRLMDDFEWVAWGDPRLAECTKTKIVSPIHISQTHVDRMHESEESEKWEIERCVFKASHQNIWSFLCDEVIVRKWKDGLEAKIILDGIYDEDSAEMLLEALCVGLTYSMFTQHVQYYSRGIPFFSVDFMEKRIYLYGKSNEFPYRLHPMKIKQISRMSMKIPDFQITLPEAQASYNKQQLFLHALKFSGSIDKFIRLYRFFDLIRGSDEYQKIKLSFVALLKEQRPSYAMATYLKAHGITTIEDPIESTIIIDQPLVLDIIETRNEIAHQNSKRRYNISKMLYERLLPIVKQIVDTESIAFDSEDLAPWN
ncbi:MAG: hypothetical protein FWC27_11050 [Firmicutes bacterium]|nr:hypothetical protein [Bacillota bacterium]